MNEAETRADHIDPALKAAGWGVAEGSRIRREYPITLGRLEGHGRRAKALTADYLLIYRNKLQAAAEVDAWTLYRVLSEPLEELAGRSPVEAVTADSVDAAAKAVFNVLGVRRVETVGDRAV